MKPKIKSTKKNTKKVKTISKKVKTQDEARPKPPPKI
jgi:hypothetical protein